jgi:hypothetical protein
MAQPAFDDDDEPPLDPAAERVQARLRRLILISGLTLGVGIFAVFAGVVYRIVADEAGGPAARFAPGDPVPTLTFAEMGLPAGARLVSSALDGGRILLTYDTAAGPRLVLLDAETLAVVATVAIGGE